MGRLVKVLFGSLSVIVALIAIGIGYLKLNDVYRQKCESFFVSSKFLKQFFLLF
jgi:hypothetical protein